MSEIKHTPTPPECIGMPMSTNPTGKLVTLSEDVYKALKGKKPAFIIRAVNSHEQLLIAAKEAMKALKHWGDKAENYEKANDPVRLYAHGLLHEAIAKAEGE